MIDTSTVLVKQLRAHPLVRGMPEEDVARLLRHAREVRSDPLEVIFEEGAPADTFYLIVTGVVSLRVRRGHRSARRIQSVHEGSVLGWSWLFPPYQWQFEAVAETPVRAIAIDAAPLRAEFDADPAFGYRFVARIAEVMAKRLYATRQQVLNLMGA